MSDLTQPQNGDSGEIGPIFAEGLEVLDGSTPWRNPGAMPPKPGGFLYGLKFKNHPKMGNADHPCGSAEELLQVLSEHGPHIDVVYLPDQDFGVPRLSLNRYSPWEKKDLKQLFFKTLQTRGLLAVATIGGAIYLNSASSFTLFLVGLIFGIVPVFDSLIQWLMYPGHQSHDELKRSMVSGSVFFDWIEKGKKPKYLIWFTLAIFAFVFYGQMKDGDVGFMASTEAGSVDPAAIRIKGEWWRIFTGTLMHAAIWHVAMNALGFFYIGKFIHRLTLPIMVPIVFVVSALVGALASTYFGGERGSVGASGGVVGMIGFLAWLVLVRRKDLPYDFRSFTIRNIILLAILGIIGFFFVDNAGHAGGFLGGIWCGAVYHFFHRGQWDVPNTAVKSILGVMSLALLLFGFGCCVDLFFFDSKYLIDQLPRFPW